MRCVILLCVRLCVFSARYLALCGYAFLCRLGLAVLHCVSQCLRVHCSNRWLSDRLPANCSDSPTFSSLTCADDIVAVAPANTTCTIVPLRGGKPVHALASRFAPVVALGFGSVGSVTPAAGAALSFIFASAARSSAVRLTDGVAGAFELIVVGQRSLRSECLHVSLPSLPSLLSFVSSSGLPQR